MRQLVRILVTAFFVSAGIAHFTTPEPYVAMMPAFLPFPAELVALSGVLEILGGVGLAIPQTRKAAAIGLLALLVAVFPANINMAVNELYLFDMPHEQWLLWARLPLQLVFGAVVYWAGFGVPNWRRQAR